MTPTASALRSTATAPAHAAERHPKGLYVLFATEMWERFSFYSMLAMFTLYLQNPTQGFGWTAAEATGLYANYLDVRLREPARSAAGSPTGSWAIGGRS